jgi:hypothetical protein
MCIPRLLPQRLTFQFLFRLRSNGSRLPVFLSGVPGLAEAGRELVAHLQPGAGQTGLHICFGDAQDLSSFRDAEMLYVSQDENGAILFGKRIQCRGEGVAQLFLLQCLRRDLAPIRKVLGDVITVVSRPPLVNRFIKMAPVFSQLHLRFVDRLRAYLAIGAKICGPPAIDREFKTIDFLILLNLQGLHPRVRARSLQTR